MSTLGVEFAEVEDSDDALPPAEQAPAMLADLQMLTFDQLGQGPSKYFVWSGERAFRTEDSLQIP